MDAMNGKTRLVTIDSSGLRLEGMLHEGEEGRVPALVCAPHPQYGGSMHNDVVVTLAEALGASGRCVLRFNYRGVGRSEGGYGGGRGEAADTGAAADFLRSETGADRVMVCAYSFGAWVAMLCRQGREDLSPLILVSPPNTMMDFDFAAEASDIHVLAGSMDDTCDLDLLGKQFPGRITVIDGADHFYSSGLGELARKAAAIAAEYRDQGS
jgi:alpha/beta superfamily hydrolase